MTETEVKYLANVLKMKRAETVANVASIEELKTI